MHVHRHQALRTELFGARKRHPLSAEMASSAELKCLLQNKRESSPKTCYFRSLRQVPGHVAVYLRPVLYPSDGELLNEGMHV